MVFSNMFIGSHWKSGVKAKFRVESTNVELYADKSGGPATWLIDGKAIVKNNATYSFPDDKPRTIEVEVDDPATVRNLSIIASKNKKIDNTVRFDGSESSHKSKKSAQNVKVRVDINPF